MKDLEPLVKLDTVLTILVNNPFGLEYNEIKNHLDKMKDNLWAYHFIADLSLILEKLEKDGNIRLVKLEELDIVTNKHKRWVYKYFATYDGKILNLKNGYSQEYINSFQIENRKSLNDYWLVRGTWAAGIGGFLLFAMELIKYFFPSCKS